ncbi:MAG: Diaminopimelate epimerase [bacterium ADurb.Bin363]|nr:MAG: Diaminopimelate epimerase [bacterium ADurb.Bin363]
MHGLGNDFIIITATEAEKINSFSHFSLKACNRHFGIGADGVIFVLTSEKERVKIRIFNSDGTEAEMCGNGIRCLARFVYEKGIVKEKKFPVETLAGIIIPEIIKEKDRIKSIRVDMGEPSFDPEKIPVNISNPLSHPIQVGEKIFLFTALSTGPPHTVIFEIPEDWEKLGKEIEKHIFFPGKTNVDFVNILNKEEAIVKVWERGAGATLACGTGACAVTAAGVMNKLLERKVKIHLPGGTLFIEWSAKNNHLYMEGSAEEVFRGEIPDGII